jgi:NTE family protein
MLFPNPTQRIGFTFSGGGVRGMAHIGVIKALTERGWRADYVAGTSAGSLIGAGLAAGMDWQALAEMASAVSWPKLLHGARLEKFCRQHLPATFEKLQLPLAVVVTEFPMKRSLTLRQGDLASALNASCALPVIRRAVWREGLKLKDGGYTCVLPAQACRALGADFVFGSDVWELSALFNAVGCDASHPLFPNHYREAVRQTNCLIQPRIAARDCWPSKAALLRLIAAGEAAVERALSADKGTNAKE